MRTFMDRAVRLLPTCPVRVPITVGCGGRAGRWAALLLIAVVVLLLLLAAVERWFVLPVSSALRSLAALLRRRR
ncbi:MAG TPA: hypothetical protein VF142_21685 [Longimicrobium sp.]